MAAAEDQVQVDRSPGGLLLAALAAIIVLGYVARAFAPTLLARAPLVLALFDGRTASLLILENRLPTVSFVVATGIGMSLGDPIAFALGRRHGAAAINRIRVWFPTTGILFRYIERFMGWAHGAPLVLTSGYASCAIAGASRVTWPSFLIFNFIGVVWRIALVLALGDALDSQLNAIGDWISDWSTQLTALTIALVTLDYYLGRRRSRDAANPRRAQ